MDFVALIEQAGLRVVNGHLRLRAALSLGQQVIARDSAGAVYRIAIENNALVVSELPGSQANQATIIVATVKPTTLH
ncbi:hypothetical protein D3C77_548780 [compost metagenome]